MTAIIEFFQFIIDMVKQLISLVGMAFNVMTSLLSMVPPVISGSMGVLITICIIYKILGRENQS